LNEHLEKIRQLERQLEEHKLRGTAEAEETKSHVEELLSRSGWDDDDGASTTSTIGPMSNLRSEVAEAVERSNYATAQNSEAMLAVKALTERIDALEAGVTERVASEVDKVEKRWESWRAKIEEDWKRDRESWEVERERLQSVVREWEQGKEAMPKRKKKRRSRTKTSPASLTAVGESADEGGSAVASSSNSEGESVQAVKEPDKAVRLDAESWL
jgi:hypothetical protein